MTDEREVIELPRFVGRIGILQRRDWRSPTDASGWSSGMLMPFTGVFQPAIQSGNWPFLALSYLALGSLGGGAQSGTGRRPVPRRGADSDESPSSGSSAAGRIDPAEGRSWDEVAAEPTSRDVNGEMTVGARSHRVVRPAVSGTQRGETGVTDRSTTGRLGDSRNVADGRSRDSHSPGWAVLDHDRPARRAADGTADSGFSRVERGAPPEKPSEWTHDPLRDEDRRPRAGHGWRDVSGIRDPPLVLVDRATSLAVEKRNRSRTDPRDGSSASRPGRVDDSQPPLKDDSRPRRERTDDDRAERPDTDASDSGVDRPVSVTEAGASSEEFDSFTLMSSRDLTSGASGGERGDTGSTEREGTGGAERRDAGSTRVVNSIRGFRRPSTMTVLQTNEFRGGGRTSSGWGEFPVDRQASPSPSEGLAGEAPTEAATSDRPTTDHGARTTLGRPPGNGTANQTGADDSRRMTPGAITPDATVSSAPPTDAFPRLTVQSRGFTTDGELKSTPDGLQPGGERGRTPGGLHEPPDMGGRSGTAIRDDAERRDDVERSARLADVLSGSVRGDLDRVVDQLYEELQRRIRIERERRGR